MRGVYSSCAGEHPRATRHESLTAPNAPHIERGKGDGVTIANSQQMPFTIGTALDYALTRSHLRVIGSEGALTAMCPS
jgi:hypothetical protein